MSYHSTALSLTSAAAARRPALSGFRQFFKAINGFVAARRHRRQARMLAGLDSRMLADIGITRSDVSDAFSTPFWEDPTLLLRERAIERRLDHAVAQLRQAHTVEPGFRRPPIDRPARQAI